MHGLLSLLSSLPFLLAYFLTSSRTGSYSRDEQVMRNWPSSGYSSLLAVVVGIGFLGHYIADTLLQTKELWHW
jgi:hypothetical protein